ncbi:MAG TPA: bifunctional DNA-formamidopyrimidine glycosylase/DNA-(apurinic or apyrimidinic site) lyase [Candidatus Sulfotelmatobacter sp.]|jgi:formamidopyrimidine-DNA glycosylase|nr:bifunctional DNA-formamidopyrimidine glycosylase/DNA-(apurinic or apyrimidinic site) lyase [Candidatus Sulfotelmatobacter sp.]
MPELPEVETIARGLAKRVTGDVVESVWLTQKKESLKSPASEIAAVLEQSHITAVRRMGKHIVFDLEPNQDHVARAPSPAKTRTTNRTTNRKAKSSSGSSKKIVPAAAAEAGQSESSKAQWIVHLGMTGSLRICEPQTDVAKHTHAILKLSSGRELRFVDPRRFGRLSVASAGDFAATGVEPLEVDLERFIPLFRGRETPIKSALLNQKLLRGVGNIYADESLFRAGIRPRRRAASITRDQLGKLFVAVQAVLKEAIALGGSSVSDYVDADGEEGFFQLQHRVYGREAEPCLVCKTPIKRVVIAGRSSHYCPRCQK